MIWRPKVLAVAPYCDGTDVGEAFCAFNWVQELSKHADVTLLTQERQGRVPLVKQLPHVSVMSRFEPSWALRFERLNAMAKLSYPGFYMWARQQIKVLLKCKVSFDIAHQFSPIALRFPSPLRGLGIPYVLGPLGGSLSTPQHFKRECGSARWYTQFRSVDAWRLKYDALLSASYRDASLILGVAPYVSDLIGKEKLKRFEVMSELGVRDLHPPAPNHNAFDNRFRILHVGRGVRTKGLRDCIRALAEVSDLDGIHLDVAGKGEEMDICKQLALELGVDERVTFHGQISRAEVDALYRQADVFCFPSFREPSGSVVFEAFSFGLPVIAADRGGPGHVVDDTCGFRVPVTEPKAYAQNIASAIRTLYTMPQLRDHLSKGALDKVSKIGLWHNKISTLITLYEDVLHSHPLNAHHINKEAFNHV